MKRTFILAHQTARQNAVECVKTAPEGFIVSVAEPTRNLQQNAALWAVLGEVSERVVWHGKKLSPEDWKHVFTASLHKMEVVPNLDGTGFVALGLSTSRMSKREFSELIELATAFLAEHTVPA
jgi:hypothetical protein